MIRKIYTLILFSAFSLLIADPPAADPQYDVKFPEPSEIPEQLKITKNSKLELAPDGTWLLNGKPHYMISVVLAGESPVQEMCRPTPGYKPSMKWLYEQPIDMAQMQRIGFDMIGITPVIQSQVAVYPNKKTRMEENQYLYSGDYFLHVLIGASAPYTSPSWAFGKNKSKYPKEAYNEYLNANGNHWVPFSVLHPEGRKLNLRNMRECIEVSKTGKILHYELFNEPAYNDPSPYNRKMFAENFLKRKYGTVEAMNKLYGSHYKSFSEAANYKYDSEYFGLYVDWCKFMEECFTNLCYDGQKLVEELRPGTKTTIQLSGGESFRHIPMNHVNLYEINKRMGAIGTPTGGGISLALGESEAASTIQTPSASYSGSGRYMAAFLRAMADGKQIHDDETYYGNTGNAAFYISIARGYTSSSVFEWGKRGWDWKTVEQGIHVAKRWPWYILNPFAVNPIEFLKIMEGRRNIQKMADLFIPRDRKIARDIAVLHSYPTERGAGATGNLSSEHGNQVFAALMFANWHGDAILEEQLPSGRLERYKVLIAPGVKNSYDATPEILRKWVENGGILIALLDRMNRDEYNYPFKNPLFDFQTEKSTDDLTYTGPRDPRLPGSLYGINYARPVPGKDWEMLGTGGCRRKCGKGWLYFIGRMYEDYSLASVLGGIFDQHGLKTHCSVLKSEKDELASHIETESSKLGGLYSTMLVNHDKFPKLVRYTAPGLKAGAKVLDVFNGRYLTAGKDGTVLTAIAPKEAVVLSFGPEELLKKRGEFTDFSEKDVRNEHKNIPLLVSKKSAENADVFKVDPAKIKTLDLRKFANRHFIDDAPGNGKGGWSDQGAARSMAGVNFGRQVYAGVPFEIIRWDMNDNKSIIVFDNTSTLPGFGVKRIDGIRCGDKVSSLFFLQTGAWTEKVPGKPPIVYEMHHRSGKISRFVCETGKNFFDWWRIDKSNKPVDCKPGFVNHKAHVIWCVRWINPDPEDPVETISAVSSSSKTIPILIAISAELFRGNAKEIIPAEMSLEYLPHGLKSKTAAPGLQEISVLNDAKNWSVVLFDLKKNLGEKAADKNLKLVFEARCGDDIFGRPGYPVCQVRVGSRDKAKTMKQKYRSFSFDRDPEVWKKIEIPLYFPGCDEKDFADISRIYFQYRHKPKAGFAIRNLHFEK